MKFLKSLSCMCLIWGLLVILTGCPQISDNTETTGTQKPLGKVYFTYFDTVSYIYCYSGDSSELFDQRTELASSILWEYHQLFDIYHEYSGVTNLCTLNKNAGGEAMEVDQKLIDFLLYAKELHTVTGGKMNVMMGSVLKPWHDCRTDASENPADAKIPTMEVLLEADKHTDINLLEIDDAHNTLRISDGDASIDVGALGKGYATEMAARALEAAGATGYVLNIGGNIRIIGTKPDGSGWLTGIKDPAAPDSGFSAYLTISDTSCVTSGSYERFYTVKGKQYHHIIDGDTLMPADHFPAVTVITKNSGLADALSTALFCMSQEEGAALIASLDGVEALWVMRDGEVRMSAGMSQLITERK